MQMRFLPILLATAAVATAQSPLTTTFAGGNGQSGNMFDIVATNAAGVTIRSVDCNLAAGTHDIEIYTLTVPGPYAPSVNTAADWTLKGSATGVVSNGNGVATQVPLCIEEFIPAGATQAFYVVISSGGIMNYTNGTTTGALFASNADLEFYEGAGSAYAFTANFNPRVWNGNLYYDIGDTTGTGCTFADVVEYGAGCGGVGFASFYEQLASDPAAANGMDLDGVRIEGLNTGSGYLVQAFAGAGGIAPGGSAVVVPAGDDDSVDTSTVGGTLGIWVGSNCNISLGGTNGGGFTPDVATMLNNANAGLYAWTDLHSASGGGAGDIWYEESGTVATVTYLAVSGWNTGLPNTVQFIWDTATGNFSIEFEALNTTNPEDWLVGYSPAGANLDPGASDLSALTGGNVLLTAASDSASLALSANLPVLGTNWDLTTDFIDPISPIAITFFGDRSPVAVPFTAIGINAPGCDINLASAITSLSGLSAGGTATVTVALPNNPALAGALLSAQSLCLTLQNSANLLSSNGVEGLLGN
jgi:hypothetical protein